mmetsp:Transcript_40624/g.88800  ORF Transcript_40624/g.88800 Transcript_40624/m.88800 type:complete len:155 (-) Transcript_40624:79-543(-)
MRETARRRAVLAKVLTVAALGLVLAPVDFVRRCFAVSSGLSLSPARISALSTSDDAEDCQMVVARSTLAGSADLAVMERTLLGHGAKVVMYNKKCGRRDRSQGFTNRKRFRICSTLVRQATKAGKKIIARKLARGKKSKICPGDYTNPKMLPVR